MEIITAAAMTVMFGALLWRGYSEMQKSKRATMVCGVCGLEVKRVHHLRPFSEREERELLDCGHTYLEHYRAQILEEEIRYQAERQRRLAVTKERLAARNDG